LNDRLYTTVLSFGSHILNQAARIRVKVGIFCLPTNTVGEESILLGAGDEEVLNTTF
jgi:hypothetical protein